MPRGNVRQAAHVSSTSRVTWQKADITRRSLEVARVEVLGQATRWRTATLALVHSTAEYCAPVWCRSAHTHLIDPGSNGALRIVTGCLRPTPADNLPILAGIQPAELHRGATLILARRVMEPGHLIHPFTGWERKISQMENTHLLSKSPFVSDAQQLISSSDDDNGSAAPWADHRWNAEWLESTTRLRTFIHDTGTHPPGMDLPRTAWARLYRLRTGVRLFRSCLYKWGMTSSAACEYGAEEQTVDHVIQCPIHRPPHGLTVLDDETIDWLLNT